MTLNIVDMFYSHGGYTSDSAYSTSDGGNYIPLDHVTGTYIPQAVERFNSVCRITRSVDTSTMQTGNSMDDVIIAELALSIADSEYDKLHVDPVTGAIENKHYTVAKQYMLDMYGSVVNGELVLPIQKASGKPYFDLYVSTMSA
jgi:hypothetical protein